MHVALCNDTRSPRLRTDCREALRALQEAVTQMQTVRLCNIDNFHDRGSYRMRYCMAGLLYLSSEAPGCKSLFAMNGAAISHAAAFALLTAGRAACSLIRARTASSSDAGGSSPSAWLTTFLHLCDNSFVWEDTRGKPRRPCGLLQDEATAADELSEPLPPAEPEDCATGLMKTLPSPFPLSIQKTGLELLPQLEQDHTWGEANHQGFRPWNALGFATAYQVWGDVHTRALRKWERGKIFGESLMFAKESLALKVLGDRVRETVADLLDAMPRNVFDERFTPAPFIPRCGGVAKIVSLPTRRSYILGPDHTPVRHPPQLLHTLTRTLRLRLTRSALRPRSMQNAFRWNGTMSRISVAVLQRSWVLFSVWVGTRRIEMHLFLRKLTRCRCISGSFWRRRSVAPAGKNSPQISYISERLDGRTDGWVGG